MSHYSDPYTGCGLVIVLVVVLILAGAAGVALSLVGALPK